MRRTMIGMVSFSLVVSLGAVAASCGGKQGSSDVPPGDVPPVATVEPTASSGAQSSAEPVKKAPDLRDPKQVHVASWTDDDAIAALAQDCRWDPGGCIQLMEESAPKSIDQVDFLPEGVQLPEGDTRVLPPEACKGLLPLACAQVPGQSCAPDGCAQNDYDCYPKCDVACQGCAGKCVTACQECKSGCSDDACRLACAKSCGACRQECVKALDHCTTATCSEEMETCYRKRDERWMKTACPKVCPKVQECVEKCPEIEDDFTGERYRNACAQSCLKKHGKGCPSEFDRICTGDPNGSVAFRVWHDQHHEDGK